jgi:microcystin-dependent protein
MIKMAYTKFHDPWETTHYLSGRAFNHIESQWDEIKEDADEHNHDTQHYTKTSSDLDFFTTSYYTGFDADTLDGSHYTDIINEGLPVGAIVIWHGDSDTIPTGWYICNGQTIGAVTTPDLRQRFIVGAGATYNVGDTGGATSTSVTASFSVTAHAITADEMPIHTHTWQDHTNGLAGLSYSSIPSTGPLGTALTMNRTTGYAGGGLGHTHTGNTITFNDIAYEPYYYSLYYIMKVT